MFAIGRNWFPVYVENDSIRLDAFKQREAEGNFQTNIIVIMLNKIMFRQ